MEAAFFPNPCAGRPALGYSGAIRLLLLEDDPAIRKLLAAALGKEGYAVDAAASASEAEGLAETYPYDALVFDVQLPEGKDAGFDLVARLRAAGRWAPVLFLTARDAPNDRVAGLDAGGDDYLVKPFHLPEVYARLRALVRRARPAPALRLERGPLVVDFTARSVSWEGRPAGLAAKEYAVLELLASNPGRLFERPEIIDRVWSAEAFADTKVVDVYVKNIRKKLADWVVETVRGSGYRFPAG